MEAGQGPGGGEVGEPHEVRAALGTRPGSGAGAGLRGGGGSPGLPTHRHGRAGSRGPVLPGALPARRALEAGPGPAVAPLLPPEGDHGPISAGGGGSRAHKPGLGGPSGPSLGKRRRLSVCMH